VSDLDRLALDLMAAVNFVALIVFLVLLGATLGSMFRRVFLYRKAEKALPVILKRGIILFGALAILGGEAALLRVGGIDLTSTPFLRLLYVVQADVILLGALGYYAKTDLFDIDNPEVE